MRKIELEEKDLEAVKEIKEQVRVRKKYDGRHHRTLKRLDEIQRFIKNNSEKCGYTEMMDKISDVRKILQKRRKYDAKNKPIIENLRDWREDLKTHAVGKKRDTSANNEVARQYQ